MAETHLVVSSPEFPGGNLVLDALATMTKGRADEGGNGDAESTKEVRVAGEPHFAVDVETEKRSLNLSFSECRVEVLLCTVLEAEKETPEKT
jgi:hypothetical protein